MKDEHLEFLCDLQLEMQKFLIKDILLKNLKMKLKMYFSHLVLPLLQQYMKICPMIIKQMKFLIIQL